MYTVLHMRITVYTVHDIYCQEIKMSFEARAPKMQPHRLQRNRSNGILLVWTLTVQFGCKTLMFNGLGKSPFVASANSD